MTDHTIYSVKVLDNSVIQVELTLVAFFLKVFPYSCLCHIYKHFYFMPVLDVQAFLFHAYDCVRYIQAFLFSCAFGLQWQFVHGDGKTRL